ncbi:hypothetical protein LSH36_174g09047 [Paralvinella palmiformis]|uniref:Uncharacterized protein n=1 Tax=Paralvinella palmiformis TaxID=53620 RepID=A0AAD9N5X9_9ANNE|nr:hypothetical protein LSH36_174g09047 [Paralvinella palmiformis]
MLHFVDLTLQLSLNERNATRKEELLNANNKLEYLLKYYLPYNGFPDMWIFSPPFHHEFMYRNVANLKVDINYIINIMNLFVPIGTNIIFMADARKCNDNLPIAYHYLLEDKQHFNISINEAIDQMNRWKYEPLRPNINNSKELERLSGCSKKYVSFGVHMAR